MKATGIVRKLDELGRITLPKELRRTMNIGNREPMEMYTDGDSIVIKPVRGDGCRCCGKQDSLITVHIANEDTSICLDCYKLFGNAMTSAKKAGVIK